MREELLKGLTEEQIAKVKACKTTEEILATAKEEGIELTEEQLEAVSGGCGTYTGNEPCPKCGGKKFKNNSTGDVVQIVTITCMTCGYTVLG